LVWTNIIFAAFLILSVLLAMRLARGRRVGDTVHCRRCDYTLTGNQSGRCPECGVELSARNVTKGERIRPPRLAALACVCLVGLAAFGVKAIREGDWYEFRPAAWAIEDCGSKNLDTAARGWFE